MQYSTVTLPQYTLRWLGGDAAIERLEDGVWLFTGRTRGVVVRSPRLAEARAIFRETVAMASPSTDRRRSRWFYT